jgi:hypothetical protein
MSKQSKVSVALLVFCTCCLLLSACASSSSVPTIPSVDTLAPATATVAPALSTATVTASPTVEPTPTFSPTVTLTPTATPFRTANGYIPGLYNAGGCVDYNSSSGYYDYPIQVKFCVWYIEILKSGKMRVTVSWDAKYDVESLQVSAKKHSDEKNENMYLRDNLGNRYNHIEVGGDAAKTISFWGQETFNGWFLFPEPAPGATYFTFVDDDQHVEIPNMTLANPIPLNKETLDLNSQPFVIVYKTDTWEAARTESGEIMLTNLKNEKCQIVEHIGQPEGQLKTNLTLGTITFDIYKWLETEQNMGYRDYVAVGGLDGLNADQPLILRVAIPLDDQEACVADASNVLFTLTEPTGD